MNNSDNFNSVIFYDHFMKAAIGARLTPEQRCEFYEAIIGYNSTGEVPAFSHPTLTGLFIAVCPLIDNNRNKRMQYLKDVENGKKGGAPRGNTNACKPKQKTTAAGKGNAPKTTPETTIINSVEEMNNEDNKSSLSVSLPPDGETAGRGRRQKEKGEERKTAAPAAEGARTLRKATDRTPHNNGTGTGGTDKADTSSATADDNELTGGRAGTAHFPVTAAADEGTANAPQAARYAPEDRTPAAPEGRTLPPRKARRAPVPRKAPLEPLQLRNRRFYDTLKAYHPRYSREMLSDFYNFWVEPSVDGRWMRFETMDFWDIDLRLARWRHHGRTAVRTDC